MGRKMMKNYFLKLTLLKCFICSCFIWSLDFFPAALCESDFDKDTSFSIEGFSGEPVSLPCLFEIPNGDKVSVILWYRDNNPEAIFTHDARKQFSDFQQTGLLEGRAGFYKVPSPHLVIKNISQDDAGYYDCRVDFYKAPSHTTHLKVSVITLSTKIVIKNETGDILGDHLSRTVGDRLVATCLVYGGIPFPALWWLLNGRKVAGSLESRENNAAVSQIQLLLDKRVFHQSELTCLGSNTNNSSPIKKSVQILLNTPPSSINISGLPEVLHVGRTYNPLCKIEGSRPAPVVTWSLVTKNGEAILNQTEDLGPRNQSVSRLRLSVNSILNGAILSCTASSVLLQSHSVSNLTILNVFFTPNITLTLGQPLKIGSIREGIDVYFTCSIQANPSVKSTTWYHNKQEIFSKPPDGILLTNANLALQKISRKWTGEFECQASNIIGVSTSSPLNIVVQYSPVCLRTPIAVMAALNHEVSIPCKVSAFPEKVSFVWKIINETGKPINLTVDKIKSKGQKSVLLFTPKRKEDFTTLECIATNIIGKQKSPCVVQIKPYSSPYIPLNCVVSNQTWDSVEIRCNNYIDLNEAYEQQVPIGDTEEEIMSYPSSTEQLAELTSKPKYFFTVRERLSNKTIYNKSAEIVGRSQNLLFSGLTPGSDYVIVVSKINTPSWNEKIILEALTLRTAENRIRNMEQKPTKILAGWLAGLISALLIMSILAIFILRRRICLRNQNSSTDSYSKYNFAQSTEEQIYADRITGEKDAACIERLPNIIEGTGVNSNMEKRDTSLYQSLGTELTKGSDAAKGSLVMCEDTCHTMENSKMPIPYATMEQSHIKAYSYSLKEPNQDEGIGTQPMLTEPHKVANSSYIYLKSENLAFSSRESFL